MSTLPDLPTAYAERAAAAGHDASVRTVTQHRAREIREEHIAECSCGEEFMYWRGRWAGDGGYPSAVADAMAHLYHVVPLRHDLEVCESGNRKFRRVECECGWVGGWYHITARTITQLLRSDEDVHRGDIKRQQEASV